MHVLTPRAIRNAAHIGETPAAREAGVSRQTLRTYEACPDHVKTRALRWLLDEYYASLARHLSESAKRRRFVEDGRFPDLDDGLTPSEALAQQLAIAA